MLGRHSSPLDSRWREALGTAVYAETSTRWGPRLPRRRFADMISGLNMPRLHGAKIDEERRFLRWWLTSSAMARRWCSCIIDPPWIGCYGQAHKSEKSNVLLIYIRFSWEWYRCDRNATTNPLEQKKIEFFIPKKSVSKKTAKNTHFRPIFFHNLSLQQDGAMKTGHNLDCGPPQLMEKKRGEIFF